jgi:Ca2+-binding EF-hand superfamily protein
MSNANLPVVAGKKPATKGGVTAERVVWMTRTSDVHGSHLKTDMDSYLALIRRKIQEKCATTMELITQIRRNKIGESGHVTPNEFRFTLIKFGIILPQPLVDKIFNVFDSDRSGTMDFDEFAMWIMNSEFRPAFKSGNIAELSPRTQMRQNLQKVVQQNRQVFNNMKKQISFLQFVSDITRLELPLTDKQARAIFQTLDPKDTGFIDSAALLTWADTGRIVTEHEVVKPADIKSTSLEDLIKKIIGRNSKQMESSFSHIQLGQGIKISFDEFRRCLLNAGVGKNIHDVRQLFLALGGQAEGLADIDLLFKKLAPILVNPATEVSEKKAPTSLVSTSRADRFLRDRMRKCFKIVRTDIEATDPSQSGYIDAERLYKILVKRCMPLTFQDFRFVVQQVCTFVCVFELKYVAFSYSVLVDCWYGVVVYCVSIVVATNYDHSLAAH